MGGFEKLQHIPGNLGGHVGPQCNKYAQERSEKAISSHLWLMWSFVKKERERKRKRGGREYEEGRKRDGEGKGESNHGAGEGGEREREKKAKAET